MSRTMHSAPREMATRTHGRMEDMGAKIGR
jgi:hypothetical protein